MLDPHIASIILHSLVISAALECGWHCADLCVPGEDPTICDRVVCQPSDSNSCLGSTCVDDCQKSDPDVSEGDRQSNFPIEYVYIPGSAIVFLLACMCACGCLWLHRGALLKPRVTKKSSCDRAAREERFGKEVIETLAQLRDNNPKEIERAPTLVESKNDVYGPRGIASLWDEYDLENPAHKPPLSTTAPTRSKNKHTAWKAGQQITMSTEGEVCTVSIGSRPPPGKRHTIIAAQELTDAVHMANVEELQAKMVVAREAGVDAGVIQAAEKVLQRILAEQVLQDATESDDLTALEQALLQARSAGVAPDTLATGREKLRSLRAVEAIRRGCAADDEIRLQQALAEALQAGVPSYVVDEAREGLKRIADTQSLDKATKEEQRRTKVRDATNTLEQNIMHGDAASLEIALSIAKDVALELDLIRSGESTLQRLRAAEALAASALGNDALSLQKAIASAKACEVDRLSIEQAELSLKKLLALNSVIVAMPSTDVDYLQQAVDYAHAIGVESHALTGAERKLLSLKVSRSLEREMCGSDAISLEKALQESKLFDVEPNLIGKAEVALRRLHAAADLTEALRQNEVSGAQNALAVAEGAGVDKASLKVARSQLKTIAAKALLVASQVGDEQKLELAIQAAKDVHTKPDAIFAAEEKLKALVASRLLKHEIEHGDVKSLDTALEVASSALVPEELLDLGRATRRRLQAASTLEDTFKSNMEDLVVLENAVSVARACCVANDSLGMVETHIRKLGASKAVADAIFASNEKDLLVAMERAKSIGVPCSVLSLASRDLQKYEATRILEFEISRQEQQPLQKAIDAAQACGVNMEIIEEGSRVLNRLAVIARLRRALEADDLKGLQDVLEIARQVGVEASLVQEALRKIDSLLAQAALMSAMSENSTSSLEKALIVSREACVPDHILAAAVARLQVMTAAVQLQCEIKNDLEVLQRTALDSAMRVAAELQFNGDSQSIVQRLKASSEISEALHLKDIPSLKLKLEAAKTIGVASDVIDSAVQDAKLAIASHDLVASFSNDDDVAVQSALESGKKVGAPLSILNAADQELRARAAKREVNIAVADGDATALQAALASARLAGVHPKELERSESCLKRLQATNALSELSNSDDVVAIERGIEFAKDAGLHEDLIHAAKAQMARLIALKAVSTAMSGSWHELDLAMCAAREADVPLDKLVDAEERLRSLRCAQKTGKLADSYMVFANSHSLDEPCAKSQFTLPPLRALGRFLSAPFSFFQKRGTPKHKMKVECRVEESCEQDLMSGSTACSPEKSGADHHSHTPSSEPFDASSLALSSRDVCSLGVSLEACNAAVTRFFQAYVNKQEMIRSGIQDSIDKALAEKLRLEKFEGGQWVISPEEDEDAKQVPRAPLSHLGLADGKWVATLDDHEKFSLPMPPSDRGVPGSSKFEHPGWNVLQDQVDSHASPMVPRTTWYRSKPGIERVSTST